MITSLQNDQVKHVVSLQKSKGRKEYGEYLIEGKRFVQEAFLRKAKVKKIFYCSEEKDSSSDNFRLIQAVTILSLVNSSIKLGLPVEEVTEVVMRKMSATEEPQGIIAIVEKDEFNWQDVIIDNRAIILILDRIQDPGNLGTILRTALAANVRHVILTEGTVDLYNPKVLRSSMGAVFSQIILIDKNPKEIENFCRDNQCTLVLSAMEGDSIFSNDLREHYPLALIIGNEAFGPNEYFQEKVDKKYSIPMFNNVESLNAAIAAGIFLYEMRRQVQFL